MTIKFLAILLLLSMFNRATKGCHSSQHERKKRQTNEPDLVLEAQITVELREFFTTCLLDKVGDIWTWESVIDISILDTQWYENTDRSNCRVGSGSDTTECWKNRLNEYLTQDSFLMEPTRECIDEYLIFVEETSNARARVPRVRVKRQSLGQSEAETEQCTTFFPNNPLVREFITCNSEEIANLPIIREEIDFSTVSQFIAENTICSSEFEDCDAGNEETISGNDQTVPEWSYRFEAITRQESPVRISASLCNSRIFPLGTGPSGRTNSVQNIETSCTDWSLFGPCSATCGVGRQTRARNCPGNLLESQARECTQRACVPQRRINPNTFFQLLLQLFNFRG